MPYEESFLREAIRLSRDHMEADDGGPFGAVIVKDGAIVGRGWNQVTTANDPTAHAEVMAIRDACAKLETFHLDGCAIYASCEPCPMCLSAIYWARLDALYYAGSHDDAARAGFDDSKLNREVALGWNQRELSAEQHLQPEARVVFEAWINKPDRVEY